MARPSRQILFFGWRITRVFHEGCAFLEDNVYDPLSKISQVHDPDRQKSSCNLFLSHILWDTRFDLAWI
jgi:hypothetical protein